MHHAKRILAMPENKPPRKKGGDRSSMPDVIIAPAICFGSPPTAPLGWGAGNPCYCCCCALQTGYDGLQSWSILNCNDVVIRDQCPCSSVLERPKRRRTPLRRDTTRLIAGWIRDRKDSEGPLFPSIRGDRLSRDALEHLVRKYCAKAAQTCPSLEGKRVTPHTLRHSTAMELLHSGVDQAVIALWLGHESVETTQIYIHADMRLKENALRQVTAPGVKSNRYRPDDQLLAFLESL